MIILRDAIVVYPEPLTAMQISGVLERLGYEATIAQSAREALCTAIKPELAVVGVQLPDSGGPALAQRLEAAAPGLRVVYVSRMTRSEAISAGMPPDAQFVWRPSIERGLALIV